MKDPGVRSSHWLIRGAFKIKLKNTNKKRTVTVRREISFGISQGIYCWSGYTVVFRPKFNLQPLSFTFETFGKKLAKTKIVARVNVKKIKSKKREKKRLNHLRWSGAHGRHFTWIIYCDLLPSETFCCNFCVLRRSCATPPPPHNPLSANKYNFVC